MLEVRQAKTLAKEMEVPHWYAKLFLEDGMLLDLSPGAKVAEKKAFLLYTQMFSITLTSFIHFQPLNMAKSPWKMKKRLSDWYRIWMFLVKILIKI